jgi:hypothetical protein
MLNSLIDSQDVAKASSVVMFPLRCPAQVFPLFALSMSGLEKQQISSTTMGNYAEQNCQSQKDGYAQHYSLRENDGMMSWRSVPKLNLLWD